MFRNVLKSRVQLNVSLPLVVAALVLLMLSGTAMAVPTIVNLGTVDNFDGPNDLNLNLATTVYAVNNHNGAGLTVNGVPFSADNPGPIPGYSVTGGSLLDWTSYSMTDGAPADNAALNTILQDIRCCSGTGAPHAYSFAVAPGKYEVQVLWGENGANATTRNWDIEVEGALAVDQVYSNGEDTGAGPPNLGGGVATRWTYTADILDGSLDIRLGQIGGLPWAGGDSNYVVSAFIVNSVEDTGSAVPEPSAFALSALALFALGLFGWRFQRGRAAVMAGVMICLLIAIGPAAFAVELPATPGSTLMHHWDAFDPVGLGVQPPPGPVAPWVDLAGVNNAPVSFGTPIYNPGDGTTIGGQPTFRFTTADGFRSMNPINDQSVTMFSVSKMNGGTSRRLITGTPNNYLLGYHGNVEDTGFNGNWFGGMTAATTTPHMYIHVAANGGTDTLLDGSTVIPNTRGPGAATAISNVGFGGRNWSGGEASDGDISEVIVFDSDMDPLDFNNVGLYLAQKYGFVAFGHDGSVLGGGPVGSAVPEPSAFMIGLLGLLGMVSIGWRRRARRGQAM